MSKFEKSGSGSRAIWRQMVSRFSRIASLRTGLIAILWSNLACRPVVAIGWQEIVIVAFLLLVLLGPTLFRLVRRLVEFQTWRNQKDKNPPGD